MLVKDGAQFDLLCGGHADHYKRAIVTVVGVSEGAGENQAMLRDQNTDHRSCWGQGCTTDQLTKLQLDAS